MVSEIVCIFVSGHSSLWKDEIYNAGYFLHQGMKCGIKCEVKIQASVDRMYDISNIDAMLLQHVIAALLSFMAGEKIVVGLIDCFVTSSEVR